MKKILVLLMLVALVGCGSKVATVESENDSIQTRAVEEEIDFRTIEEEDSELEQGEKEVVTKGVKGMKVVVYNDDTDEYLNEWTYTEPVAEVVRVGTKGKDKPTEQTPNTSVGKGSPVVDSNSGGNGTVAPPNTSSGGNGTVAPPTTTAPPKEPSKPSEPYVLYGSIGNSGREFKSVAEASAFGDSVLADYDTLVSWEEKLGIDINGWGLNDIEWSNGTHTYSIRFY